MTNYKDSDWEKRFEKKFAWVSEAGSPLKAFVFPMQYNEVKSFLHQELDRARKEERKTILNHITKIVLKYHNDYIAMCEIIKYFTKLKTK